MTPTEFNKLDLDERYDAILEWGFYLGKRKLPESNKILYSVHGYYAEVDIRLADNKLLEAKAFSKIDASKGGLYLMDKENPFIKLLGAVDGSE